MKQILTAVLFNFILINYSFSQSSFTEYQDSLIKVINNTMNDSLKMARYYDLFSSFKSNDNIDEQIVLIKQAIVVGENSNIKIQSDKFYPYYSLANRFHNVQKDDSAIKYIDIYINKPYLDSTSICRALLFKNRVLRINGNYNQAIKSLNKAIKYSNHSQLQLLSIYHDLAQAYTLLEKDNNAFKYYNKAKKIAINEEKHESLIDIYKSISYYYLNKGMSDSALKYAKSCLEINTPEVHIYMSNLMLLSDCFMQQKTYDSSQFYLKKTIDIQKKNPFVSEQFKTKTQHDLARVIMLKGNPKKAIEILVPLIKKSKPTLQRFLYYSLIEAYKRNNQLDSALSCLFKLDEIKDSLSRSNLNNQLLEIETKYESAKKNKQILSLKNKELESQKLITEKSIKNKRLQIYLILIAGGILLLAGIIYYFHKKKKLNEKIEQEVTRNQMILLQQKALKTQIDTHFIFNAIDVSQGLIVDNKYDEARKHMNEIGKLIRLTLENSSENRIPLQKEIKYLNSYLTINQLLFPNKFTYLIDVSPNIDIINIFIPPMLLQPLVENAIIHGAIPNEQTEILIKINDLNQGEILCTIINKSHGVNTDKNANIKNKSMGLSITNKRLQINNLDENARVVVNQIQDNAFKYIGTKAELIINHI